MKVSLFNKKLWENYFVVLGIIATVLTIIGFFVSISPKCTSYCTIFIPLILLIIFGYMYYQANFLSELNLKINNTKIVIRYGDIFNSEGLKLIPFNEYFDTIVDNKIIAKKSLNGIFVSKLDTDIAVLDTQISNYLLNKRNETIKNRPTGNKKRYKLGTTVEVENEYALIAFTHFNKKNEAYLSHIELLNCLNEMWYELNTIYAQRDINIPLLGSGISRINNFSPQKSLEYILTSFNLSDRTFAHNTTINIILYKDVKEEINLFDIKTKF